MISAEFDAAWQATWPAADYTQIGGFRVGRGQGGGGRVSAARVTGPWDAADIADVEAQHADWGQPELFAVEDLDTALADALAAKGYVATKPTLILDADIASLADVRIPAVTALETWPPLAIVRDLWAEQEISPARQAVMERAAMPKTSILGRVEDRAAGAGFVSVHGRFATIHALAVLPQFRRKGVAGWIIRRAAKFGQQDGADRLALAVTQANSGARAVYDALGFQQIGSYSYWQRD